MAQSGRFRDKRIQFQIQPLAIFQNLSMLLTVEKTQVNKKDAGNDATL